MADPAVDTDFKIATYASGIGGLSTLRSLRIPNPHPVWVPGVSSEKLGDNGARILGSPAVVWQWGFISQYERDILRAYCPGAYSNVYIITTTTEKVGGVSNVAKRYLAKMIWPPPSQPENPQTGRRLEFSIMLRQLVVV
jgi:hypothetical protein